MSSIFQKSNSLPVSHSTTTQQPPSSGSMRKRISSMSFKIIQPPMMISSSATTAASASAWALRSSKSVSASMGESAKNWWGQGWAWILSRKPVFAQDLEMNQDETSVLGCHNKGSWRHILYKFRSEIRKLILSDQPGLPQTIR